MKIIELVTPEETELYANKKFDHRWTFVKEVELKFINKVKEEIAQTSTYDVNIILPLLWVRDKKDIFNLLLKNTGNVHFSKIKIWMIGICFEPDDWYTPTTEYWWYKDFKNSGFAVELIGNFPDHYFTSFPYYLIKDEKYNEDDYLLYKEPKYLFLCYNNKHKISRFELVKSLINENLHNLGIITYRNGYFPELDEKNDLLEYPLKIRNGNDNTGDNLFGVHYTYFHGYMTFEIGQLDLWKNSYCWVTSETQPKEPWFISEKTFKAMLGIKPYMVNGHPNYEQILNRLGFYTPSELFKNNKLASYNTDSIVEQLNKLRAKTPKELYELYESQLPMLLSNRNRLLEIGSSGFNKILNWPFERKK